MLMNGLRLCGSLRLGAKQHIRVEYPRNDRTTRDSTSSRTLYLNNQLFCYDAVP